VTPYALRTRSRSIRIGNERPSVADESPGGDDRIVLVDAKHDESLLPVHVVILLDQGHFRHAGRAIGAPEIDQDRASPVIGQAELPAVKAGQDEIRRRIADAGRVLFRHDAADQRDGRDGCKTEQDDGLEPFSMFFHIPTRLFVKNVISPIIADRRLGGFGTIVNVV